MLDSGYLLWEYTVSRLNLVDLLAIPEILLVSSPSHPSVCRTYSARPL